MIDLRFPTALQAVLMLAAADRDGIRATSATLAEGLGTNPSFVRRLLVPLSRAGIVSARMGQKGGIGLGRSPTAITLRDIYKAIIDDKVLWASREGVPERCFVSANITCYFGTIAAEAHDTVLAVLGRRTVTSCLADLRTIADAKGKSVERKRRATGAPAARIFREGERKRRAARP